MNINTYSSLKQKEYNVREKGDWSPPILTHDYWLCVQSCKIRGGVRVEICCLGIYRLLLYRKGQLVPSRVQRGIQKQLRHTSGGIACRQHGLQWWTKKNPFRLPALSHLFCTYKRTPYLPLGGGGLKHMWLPLSLTFLWKAICLWGSLPATFASHTLLSSAEGWGGGLQPRILLSCGCHWDMQIAVICLLLQRLSGAHVSSVLIVR